jgi:hypothetical protein
MPHQMGLAFLGLLDVFFGSYGFAELAQAYPTASLADWSDMALPGAGGVVRGTGRRRGFPGTGISDRRAIIQYRDSCERSGFVRRLLTISTTTQTE